MSLAMLQYTISKYGSILLYTCNERPEILMLMVPLKIVYNTVGNDGSVGSSLWAKA